MEAGLDSLGAVELRNQLATEFASQNLPATLTFDYPTISALARYLASQQMETPANVAGDIPNRCPVVTDQDIASISQQIHRLVSSMLGKDISSTEVCPCPIKQTCLL